MKNDTIQGIVFDRHQTITFRDAPKNLEKLPYFISKIKQQLKLHTQQQSLKRYQPTFSTDLLPASSPKPSVKHQPTKKTYSETVIVVK